MKKNIAVSDVQFAYSDGKPLIVCHNLRLEPGNIYIFSGANGSGKTTFVKLLIGLLKPACGSITGIDDYVIGYVPDYNGLYATMTALENIKFRLALYNQDYAAMQRKVDDMLIKYRLFEARNMLVSQLSLGMQKKLALACTMLVNPDLLVMDEPTVGIDDNAQRELVKMIRSFLSSDKIVVCTSHDAQFVDSLQCKKINFPLEI